MRGVPHSVTASGRPVSNAGVKLSAPYGSPNTARKSLRARATNDTVR